MRRIVTGKRANFASKTTITWSKRGIEWLLTSLDARPTTSFGKRIWKSTKFVLGGPSGIFGRCIAPTFKFAAHAMIHVANAQYFEMCFVTAHQSLSRRWTVTRVKLTWTKMLIVKLIPLMMIVKLIPLTLFVELIPLKMSLMALLTRPIHLLQMKTVEMHASIKNGSSRLLECTSRTPKECATTSRWQLNLPRNVVTMK
jgi:hypothetical protein